jgi:uncharacterized glyoxalase superfamily protein PhnB
MGLDLIRKNEWRQIMTENLKPTTRVTFKNAIPKHAARDIAKAVEFYVQKLGFRKVFLYDGGAVIMRDAVEIHLWQCDDKYIAENTACRVNVEGIEALYEEMRAQGAVHPNGRLETKPWGLKEFTVLDLDGNGITFAERV